MSQNTRTHAPARCISEAKRLEIKNLIKFNCLKTRQEVFTFQETLENDRFNETQILFHTSTASKPFRT